MEIPSAHRSLAPPLPPLPKIPSEAYPRTTQELLAFVEQAYSTASPYRLSVQELRFHPQLTATVVKPVLDHFFPLTSRSSRSPIHGVDEEASSIAGPSRSNASVDPNDASQDAIPGAMPLPPASLNPNSTSSQESPDDLMYLQAMLLQPGDAGDQPVWRKEKGLAVLYMLDARLQSRPLSEASHPVAMLELAQKVALDTEVNDLLLAAERLGSLAENVTHLAAAYGLLPTAIDFLQTLITRCSRTGHLTPMHGCLLENLYQLGSPHAAQPWLSETIESFSWPGLSYRDVLCFFYMRGMFAIAAEQWDVAKHQLEIVVTVPASTCSSIQIAAHRKLVFVSLITSGHAPRYPRYQSSAVQRTIRNTCKEYAEMANAFEAMNEDKVIKVAQDHAQVFEQHGDIELMRRALSTYGERKLLQLPAMYARMSIEDVAAHASSLVAGNVTAESCEEMIEALVSRRLLHATVDRESIPPSVRFIDSSEAFISAQSAAQVSALVRQADMLEQYMKGYDDEMGLHVKWLRRAIDKDSLGEGERASALANPPVAAVRGVGSNWNDTGF